MSEVPPAFVRLQEGSPVLSTSLAVNPSGLIGAAWMEPRRSAATVAFGRPEVNDASRGRAVIELDCRSAFLLCRGFSPWWQPRTPPRRDRSC